MNGVPLHGDGILFLNNDPNFMLEGLNRFPAGMKLGVSYCYFPLEPLADDPLFAAVLEGVQYFQKTRVCEQKHLDQLEKLRLTRSRPSRPCRRISPSCIRPTPS